MLLGKRGTSVNKEIDLSRLKGYGFMLLGENPLEIYNPYSVNEPRKNNHQSQSQSKPKRHVSSSIDKIKSYFRSPRQLLPFQPQVYPIFNEQILLVIGNTLSLYNIKFKKVLTQKNNIFKRKSPSPNLIQSQKQQEQKQQKLSIKSPGKQKKRNNRDIQQTNKSPQSSQSLSPNLIQIKNNEKVQIQQPVLQKVDSIQTYHDIKSVYIPQKKYYQHNSQVFILLTFSNSSSISVIKQDYRNQKIQKIHDIYFKNQKVEAILSINDSQFIICCTNKNKNSNTKKKSSYFAEIKLYYYYISAKSCKCKYELKLMKKLKKNEELTAVQIGGKILDDQDSTLLVFQAIYDKQILVSKIVAQQIIKPSFGGLQLPSKKQSFQKQEKGESLKAKILNNINIPFFNRNFEKSAQIQQQKQEENSPIKRPYFPSMTISSFTSNLFNINSINSPYNYLKSEEKNNKSQSSQSNNPSMFYQKNKSHYHHKHNQKNNQSQILVVSSIKQAVTQIKMFYRNQSYFFFLCDQIVVVRKKFGKYFIIDTISDKIRNQRVCYCKTTQLVSTVGKQGIQLYHLQVTDKKCNYKLIDIIQDINNIYRIRRTLTSLWTYEKDSQIHIGLIFSGHMGKLYFQGVKSVQQIKKITQFAYEGPRQQVGKVQQMAQKLGISKKDFYITLWSISKKNLAQIFAFLLPCSNLQAIHRQIASFLRRKQLTVGQIMKILQKIQSIIFQSLTKNLEVQMLKWYIKNNFLMRKFLLYPVDLKIDWAQFQSIYEMGIDDIIKQSIDQQLFPAERPVCTFGVPQPKKKPKIYINHALQQFRLILLENYEGFLISLLKDYPKHIALILQNFTQLLPKYPLKIQMISQQNLPLGVSLIASNLLVKNCAQAQQIWFSNVTISEWNRQKMKKQKIIQQLKPYYPTSQIINKINLLIKQTWFTKKRLKRHTLIQSNTQQYQQILKNISDKHIYLTICQFANQMQYKHLIKQGQVSISLHNNSSGNHIGDHSRTLQQKSKYNDSNLQYQSQSRVNVAHLSGFNLADNTVIQKRQKSPSNFLKQIPSIKIVTPINQKSQINLKSQRKQKSSQKESSNKLNPLDLFLQPSKKTDQGQARKRNSLEDPELDLTKSFALDPIQQKRNTKKRILASKRILQSLNKHNRLHGQPLDECKLYLAIHHFLQIQGLIQQQLTVQALLNMSDAQLVSLFFLGNKQKKYLIFNEFRSLYSSVQKFNNVIGNFANSQSSSIIELQILLMQITGNKKSSQISEEEQYRLNQFQRNNQQLIKVIVDGVCKKIELRQITPMIHFFVLINNVQLNKDLLVLINKINQLKRCLSIFDNFYMAEKTYYEILYNSKEIIEEIMDQYFKGNVMHHSINIQKETISLNYTRNTFNLLLYLRQTVFYDITQRQLLMLYGQILIDWQQFQALQQLLYYQSIMQMLQSQEEFDLFINQLLTISLDKIYSKQDIIFDDSTKTHIKNILKLQRNITPFTIKEHSKLFIVKLFESWGYFIRPIYLETMCLQWQQSAQNRKQLITQFFNKYIDSINYQNFQQLYQYFQMTATGDPNIQIHSKQFFQYCKMLATQLVKKQRSLQAALIINIIRLSGQIQAGYQLQSQCALTCLSKNKGLQGLQLSRRFIQFMVLNYQNDDVIAHLFGSCFNSVDILQKYDFIDTHQSLCYKQQGRAGQSQFMRKHGITIPLDGLWQITNTLAQYRAVDISTIKGISSIFDKSQLIHDDAAITHEKSSINDQSIQKPRKRSRSNFNPTNSIIQQSPQQNQNQQHQVSDSVFSIFANLFNAVNNPSNQYQTSSNTLNPNSLSKKKKQRKTSINLQSMNFQIYNPIMNSYYFLLMGLRFPHLGFSQLYSLPYNFNMLLMLLHRLDNMVHKYRSLWRLNVEQIYEMYRKGLYALLLREVDVDHSQIQLNEHFYDQIRQKVKNTPNSQAIKIQLTRLQQQFNNVRMKRKQRQKVHEQECKKNIKVVQKVFGQLVLDQQYSDHQIDYDANKSFVNVTCTYHQMKQMKKQINNISKDLTERMIMDTVVDHMSGIATSYQDSQLLGMHSKSNSKLNISTPFGVLDAITKDIIRQTRDKRDFTQMKRSKDRKRLKGLHQQGQSIKNCTISEFQIWILQKKYDKIKLVPQKVVEQRFSQLWFSQMISFDILIQTLKQAKIGNMHKIQPLSKINKHLIKCHNLNLKSLFSIEYLLSFEVKSDQQLFEQYMIPKLRMFLCDLSLADITSLGQILSEYFENNAIQHEIYGLAIQLIGQDGIFEEQNILKLQGLIKITDIQYLMANYTKLMDSMVKTMLRQVCHNCIMKKVQEQFQSHVSTKQKKQNKNAQEKEKLYDSSDIRKLSNYDMEESQVLQS